MRNKNHAVITNLIWQAILRRNHALKKGVFFLFVKWQPRPIHSKLKVLTRKIKALVCFICFSQKFSVLRGTEISVVRPQYRNFCDPQYRKFLWKADETNYSIVKFSRIWVDLEIWICFFSTQALRFWVLSQTDNTE